VHKYLWVFVAFAAICFLVPTLASADENPIDKGEYGHLSGGLVSLFGTGGGVGGGSLQNSTCTSTGGSSRSHSG